MIKRYKICLITEVTNYNCAKISLISYLSKNLRDSYDIHILCSKSYDFEFLKKYGTVKVCNDELLDHLYETQTYKNIILLNEKTFCIGEIDNNFTIYKQFHMTGNLRYQDEFDIMEYKIPFVTGVFSDGFMFLSNLKFNKDDPDKFMKTFKFNKTENFTRIFLSWLCTKKLKVSDISAETRHYHSLTLDNRLIYFSDDQPWNNITLEKTPYIYRYLDKYCSFAQQLGCDIEFIENIKNKITDNIESEFQEDLKYKYTYRTPYHVYIPLCEREMRLKLYG